MIVADTNLIAYLMVLGDRTPQAKTAFRRDPLWVAPPLWRSEFRNALAVSIRHGVLSLEQAVAAAQHAETLLAGKEFAVQSAPVLTLALQSGCSACDCEFVALATDLGVPLITSDRTLAAKFPGIAVSLEAYAT